MLLPLLPPTGRLMAQTGAYPAIADVDPVSALSRYLRMLASNPRDLASLTGAGRAALAVGDASAALGFYARAEEIAPRNGRIKAGLASALVQMEQPRTALKLFDEAVALGVPTAEIAADRGLAHDLNGDARRAQADYTIALRSNNDDETARRLALSMAVSGDRDGALAILSPLLRRRDSGAERAKAFVLALTGDPAGAAGVVRAAMPAAQASAMLGFMNRLNGLNPAQKALAVNFGYFPSDGRSYSAAELFADARAAPLPAPGSVIGARDPRRAASADTPLIPFGEALGPRLAANEATTAPRRRPGQEDVLPPPHVLSAPIPGVTPEPLTGRRAALVARQGVPTARPATAGTAAMPAITPPVPAAVALSATTPGVVTSTPVTAGGAAGYGGTGAAGFGASGPVAASASQSIVPTPTSIPAAASQPATVPITRTPSARIATVTVPGAHHRGQKIEAVEPTRSPPTNPDAAGKAAGRIATDTPRPAHDRRPATKTAEADTPTDGRSGTDVKGKSTTGQTRRGGRNGKLAALDPETKASSDRDATTEKSARARNGKAAKADEAGAGKKSGTDRNGKAGADKKETADRKTDAKSRADGKTPPGKATKAAAKEETKPAAKPATAERYWVQVASGANKANLDKAWAEVRSKAPKQLSGQSTYTAPWRASNRLLIGPFETADEAQAKVNSLAKSGVSGIQFTTRAGADVEKVAKK